jgi:magnesium transporter
MIRTSIMKKNGDIQSDVPLSRIKEKDVKWYWVDFSEPTSKDIRLLKLYFRFHPLAIEDCLDDFSQRPKLDF